MDITPEQDRLLYDLLVETIYVISLIGGFTMRHFYFRLILGIIFIVCMIFSIVTMNIPFALLYLILAGVYLYSAYSLWKKNKDNRG